MKRMQRWLPAGLLFLALFGFGGLAAADFTESEDSPALDPDESEDNPLSDADPVPWDLLSFTSAFPDGVKLIRGTLDQGDVDAYAFDVAYGELLLAALFEDADGEFDDTSLGVFTGGTTPPLTRDDDSAAGFLSSWTFMASSGGTHQIAVTGFGDTSFDGSHQEARTGLVPYYLAVASTTDPAPQQESEANDTQGTADPLPANGALVGGSLGTGDVDYFSIDLEEGDRLAIAVFDLETGSFTSANGELNDVQLGLFEPGGGLATDGTDDDDGLGFNGNLLHTVPVSGGGTWTIAVSGFGDAAFDGTHQEGPFDYLLLVARDRACPNAPTMLMTGIATSTAKAYVAANLQGGDHYYIDRTENGKHVLVDIPSQYECAEWIKTANNDKAVSDPNHLMFSLAQDASVYVAYDTRATAEPAWLASGFTPTGDVVDIADPDVTQEFDVLRRDFTAGSVVLGGNQAPDAGSNYVVFALPLDTTDPSQALTIPSSSSAVRVTINGVTITLMRGSQSDEEFAQALADAVNADPTLSAARIFGIASGATFVTTGSIEDSSVTLQIPALPPWGVLLLATALLVFARSRTR